MGLQIDPKVVEDIQKQIEVKEKDKAAAAYAAAGVAPPSGPKTEAQLRSDVQDSIYRIDNYQDRQDAKRAIGQAEVSRGQRELDLHRGRQRAEEFFGEGSLGRVGEDRSKDIQDVVSARRDIAERGFGAEAFQAGREARLQGLNRSQALQQRQLAASQARTGVLGGLAGAQNLALLQQQQQERQGAERDMFLADVAQRQAAISGFEQSVRGAESDELARRQYNLGQRKSEIQGALTTMYGEAAMGVAERSSAQAANAAKQYSAAMANQGGGKK